MEEKVLTQVDTEEDGNTKASSRSRNWCLTVHNDFKVFEDWIDTNGTRFIYQYEIGEETGKEHIQAHVEFTNARSFQSLKKGLPKGVHIEKCKNVGASRQYCQKEETRKPGTRPYYRGIEWVRPIKDVVKEKGARDWQQKILDIIKEEADDRKIYWVYDPDGSKGKTSLIRHICLNYNAIMVSGKANDIKCAIASMDNKPEIVLYNITRTQENYISYESLESVKDGIFFNGKYESGMIIMNPPHMIVMANCLPDLDKLTVDRWEIIDLIE